MDQIDQVIDQPIVLLQPVFRNQGAENEETGRVPLLSLFENEDLGQPNGQASLPAQCLCAEQDVVRITSLKPPGPDRIQP